MVAEARADGAGAMVGEFVRAAIVEKREEPEEWPANLAKEVGFSWRSLI